MAKGLLRSMARAAGVRSQTVRKLTIPVRNAQLSVVDGAPGYGFTLPTGMDRGNILFLGAVSYLQFSTSSANIIAAFTGTMSIGTVGTVDSDVADTGEANIIASTTVSAATAKVSPVVRGTNVTSALIDNTDGDKNLNINLLIDDASISGTATFSVNGVINLAYIVLGDD